MDFQRVAVPSQERSSSPGQRVQPDVRDGPPGPGEVNDLGMNHTDVALIRQTGESHDGHDALKDEKRNKKTYS